MILFDKLLIKVSNREGKTHTVGFAVIIILNLMIL